MDGEDEDEYERGAMSTIPADCPDVSAARELCQLMSDISEDQYCAGWLVGLEYQLFDTLYIGDTFGDGISPQERVKLMELSARCGGWWRWTDDKGETFVKLEEWLEIYKARAR